MKPASFIILLLGLMSCTNNADQQATLNDKSAEDSILVEQDGAEVLRMMIPNLFEYYSREDSSFAPSHFIMNGTAALNSQKQYAVEDQLKDFYPYLIYDQDSAFAIDLYSYNYIVQENADGKKFEAAGPDSEVALIDVKNGKRKRLLFSGPSMSFLDAKWIDKNTILIAGAEEINAEQIQPLLWKINLQDSSMQFFKYKDTLNAKSHPYLEEKLKPAPPLKSV